MNNQRLGDDGFHEPARLKHGIKRLLIGNTAERVLDLLTCDVLVVKPARFANRVPRARRGARVVATASASLPI